MKTTENLYGSNKTVLLLVGSTVGLTKGERKNITKRVIMTFPEEVNFLIQEEYFTEDFTLTTKGARATHTLARDLQTNLILQYRKTFANSIIISGG